MSIMVDRQLMKLDEIAEGSLAQAFDHELKKVIKNIDDPNTNAEDVRTITVKVKIKPAPDRRYLQFGIEVDSKLAKTTPSIMTSAFIGIDEHNQLGIREVGYGQIKGQMQQKDYDVVVDDGEEPQRPTAQTAAQATGYQA